VFDSRQRPIWVSPILLSNEYRQVKWPRCEAGQSCYHFIEFKNVLSFTPTLPYMFMVSCLIKHMENFKTLEGDIYAVGLHMHLHMFI
jgi:hypothetical protein